MNRKQIVTMWAGIVVFILLCLSPPTYSQYSTISVSKSGHPHTLSRVNVPLLAIYGVADLLVVGGLIITLKTKKEIHDES